MTASGTVQLTCPQCGSTNVVQEAGAYGCMYCAQPKCHYRWNEENEKQHDRQPHKTKLRRTDT